MSLLSFQILTDREAIGAERAHDGTEAGISLHAALFCLGRGHVEHQGVEDIVYRGKSIGKVYKGRPLKPIIVPLVLVRSAIKGTGTDVPFKWVEPAPQDGIEHGHFVVAAPDIDRAETFIMNSVRVLGPRLVVGEAQHVESHVFKIWIKKGRMLNYLDTMPCLVPFSATS